MKSCGNAHINFLLTISIKLETVGNFGRRVKCPQHNDIYIFLFKESLYMGKKTFLWEQEHLDVALLINLQLRSNIFNEQLRYSLITEGTRLRCLCWLYCNILNWQNVPKIIQLKSEEERVLKNMFFLGKYSSLVNMNILRKFELLNYNFYKIFRKMTCC